MAVDKWELLFKRKDTDMPTFCGTQFTAHKYLWEYTGEKKEYLFARFDGSGFEYYMKGFDFQEFGMSLYDKHFSDPEDIKSYYEKGKRFLKQTDKDTEKWEQVLSSNPTAGNLLEAYQVFQKSLIFVNDNYSIMPWWALEAWQYEFSEIVNKLIDVNNLEKKRDLIISSLTKAWKNTALIDIQNELERGASPEELADKYQFLRSWTVIWNTPITPEWVASLAMDETEDSKTILAEEVIDLLKPSEKQKKILQNAPYVTFFKDWRDDLRRKHVYSWSFLFEKIARKLDLDSVDDLGYFTLEEIDSALKKEGFEKEKMNVRKEVNFILAIDSETSRFIVYEENIPKRYTKAILEAESSRDTDEVSGTVACSGSVKGPVQLVNSYHDVPKVKQGDILVSNTTHPNYLPAMRRAAAFVTDEGGLTSHAAIVSRELNKPCIVGTKNATRIFKDGDMVEVDAGQNVVKKLS